MRKLLNLTMIALLVVSCSPKNANEAETGAAKKVDEAAGDNYKLISDLTTIQWRGTKPSGEHIGTVKASDGQLSVDGAMVTGGTFTIDLNTIVDNDLTGEWNAKLVRHLKSEDFFYTEAYPDAVFEIVSLSKYSGEDTDEGITPTHSVTGNLTMRGVTKSITFPVSIKIGDAQVGVKSNEFSIDRTLWGVNFKSKSVFAEFKDDFIGDMINLKIDAAFEAE